MYNKMIFKFIYLLLLSALCATLELSSAQQMKCSYGERGSLTATCENATSRFFRTTSYRFDMLDETLRCMHCNLDSVDGNSFDISGNQIQHLDLRNSNVKALKSGAFTGLVFLKSLQLQNNKITELGAGIFKGIKKVLTLDMANNQIKTIGAFTFKELGNLTTLNLQDNNIESIDGDALSGVYDLISLNLEHNDLSHVGNISNLDKMTTLNLAFNKITLVKNGDFENMTSLISLNLAHNLLPALAGNTFQPLRNLTNLDLSCNRIQEIAPNAFANLHNLEVLNLGHNEIKAIQKGAFYDLVNLRELQLNDNKLRVFHSGMFSGLPEMTYLNLSSNNLLYFVGTGNKALASLHTLDLSHNNLTDLDYRIISRHMPHISYLGLVDNPWPCYLVAEIDEYYAFDGVKLTSDGVLKNTSCTHRRKEEVEAVVSKYVEDEEEFKNLGYAHARVVYPLMAVMFLIICALCFILFQVTRNTPLTHTIRTTSHANLMSSDILANEANYNNV